MEYLKNKGETPEEVKADAISENEVQPETSEMDENAASVEATATDDENFYNEDTDIPEETEEVSEDKPDSGNDGNENIKTDIDEMDGAEAELDYADDDNEHTSVQEESEGVNDDEDKSTAEEEEQANEKIEENSTEGVASATDSVSDNTHNTQKNTVGENTAAQQSGFRVINFYHPDGRRKRADELSRVENSLRDAQINHRIISGLLESAQRSPRYGAYGMVDYEGIKIIIPAREMGIDYEDIVRTVTARYQRENNGEIDANLIQPEVDRLANNRIAERIGSRVYFTIVGGDGGVIGGSRLRAMQRHRRVSFFPTQSRATPLVHEGSRVMAQVVRVRQRDIRVYLRGYEVTLPLSDITADFVSGAYDKYKVGDRIELIIQKIEGADKVLTNTYRQFCSTSDNLKISAATEDAINYKSIVGEKLKAYPRGAVVLATVNYVTDGGICVLSMANGCAAQCFTSNTRRIPMRGDKVKFFVEKIDTDRSRINGRILEVL